MGHILLGLISTSRNCIPDDPFTLYLFLVVFFGTCRRPWVLIRPTHTRRGSWRAREKMKDSFPLWQEDLRHIGFGRIDDAFLGVCLLVSSLFVDIHLDRLFEIILNLTNMFFSDGGVQKEYSKRVSWILFGLLVGCFYVFSNSASWLHMPIVFRIPFWVSLYIVAKSTWEGL